MHVSKFKPEQLVASLVAEHDKQAVTTSLIVASHFGKRHDGVVKAIRNLIPELSNEHARYFAETFIEVDAGNGAKRPALVYRITRDGFSLLAMGFTGKKALQFKLAYIGAFNAMEAELKRRYEWQPIRDAGKGARRDLTDAIAEFVEYAKRQGSKGADHYYANFTKMEYKLLFAIAAGLPKGFRNILDVESLDTLGMIERLLGAHVRRGMEADSPYKEIYVTAKGFVAMLVDTMGGQRMLPEHTQLLA